MDVEIDQARKGEGSNNLFSKAMLLRDLVPEWLEFPSSLGSEGLVIGGRSDCCEGAQRSTHQRGNHVLLKPGQQHQNHHLRHQPKRRPHQSDLTKQISFIKKKIRWLPMEV